MKLQPNRSSIEASVLHIVRASDGIGATVEVQVMRATATEPDFVQARPGQVLELFAAVPEELRAGACYRFVVTLMAGPRSQRLVLCSAQELPGRPPTP
jgi:hypothetical protein